MSRPQNRNLRRGGPGRPPGSKDKIPRSLRGSLAAVFRELLDTEPELYVGAIRRGLKSKPPYSAKYLDLALAYIDGRPAERLKLDMCNQMDISVARQIAERGRQYLAEEKAKRVSDEKSS